MQLKIHNIQTIQDPNGNWYKIGGEIGVDSTADRIQIERIAEFLGIRKEQIALPTGELDPVSLQFIMRKYLEYIVNDDLASRR